MWVDGHMVQFQVSGGYNVRPRVLLGRNDLWPMYIGAVGNKISLAQYTKELLYD